MQLKEVESGRYFELVMLEDLLLPAQGYHELHTGIRMVPGGTALLGVVPGTPALIKEPIIAIPQEGLDELVIGLWNHAEEVLAVEKGDVIARVYFLSVEKRNIACR